VDRALNRKPAASEHLKGEGAETHEVRLQRRKDEMATKASAAAAAMAVDGKVLVSRKGAAHMLSISIRAVDYLITTKRLSTRRIGTRVVIPVDEIRRFARSDHPERVAS